MTLARRALDSKLVVRQREIPVTAGILVSVGDNVMPGQPIATLEVLPGRLWRVDVAGALGLEKTMAPLSLVKPLGERVVKNEVIAAGGMFFDRNVVRSPVTGVLAIVSKSQGFVYIREDVEIGSQESPVEVHVAKMLGVPPWQIVIHKKEDIGLGISVIKGQALASRIVRGFRTMFVEAPIYGRITDISYTKGTITISPIFKSRYITAFLKGTVTDIVPGKAVDITGLATLLNGIWGMGGEGYGPLHNIEGDLTGGLDLPGNSVIAVKGTATVEGLEHARESGVRAVILRYFGSADLMAFAGGIKNMGITGDEDLPFPVVLIEGFRPGPQVHESFKVLKDGEGLICSVRGSTHIRAGVIRPEILIFPAEGRGK